ncbi:hypothetical protein LR48_Vigan434s001400 [Vigna angularis]|uniref:Uncharacterized protein n=1 Tax=Phaseolus angularis TaxID=3914 RepID=A0A0L9TAH1_PHAAN|nr:hypothetical protein LR48_Vigan434s001400 [Vigna angularis]
MAFERSTAAPLNSAMTYDEESMERSKTPCKFPLSYLLFSLFLAEDYERHMKGKITREILLFLFAKGNPSSTTTVKTGKEQEYWEQDNIREEYDPVAYSPYRSGVAEQSKAIEDQLFRGRTCGEVTRFKANCYKPSKSKVVERSEDKCYSPCRSGVVERPEAIKDKSSWGRIDRYNLGRSRVTERSKAKRYSPGRSRVVERSVGSEQEKTDGPNGRGLTKSNGLALQAAHPRGLKEPNGPEMNGKELSNPNVKGQEEPNDLTFTVKGRTVLHSKRSPSHWPNGLTVTFKGQTVL